MAVVASLIRIIGAPASLPGVVPFTEQSSTIGVGRAETNQVVINDKKISKVHCRLTLRTCKRKGDAGGEILRMIFIKDSSTFGTFVNGKAIAKEQWIMLHENDIVGLRNPHGNPQLGEYTVKYADAAATASPTAAPTAPAATWAVAPTPLQGTGGPPREQRPPMGTYGSLDAVASPASPLSPANACDDLVPPAAAPLVQAPSAGVGLAGGELHAEPLSPLSEVSEVSAPDEDDVGRLPPPGLLPPGSYGMPPMMVPGASSVGGRPPLLVPPPGFAGAAAQGIVGMPPAGLPQDAVVNVVRPPLAFPPALQRPEAGSGRASLPLEKMPETITIQAELIGMLIGKGGETVKQLSKDSGARIEISKVPDGSPSERRVFLTGSPDSVERAKQMIEDVLSKARERSGPNNPNANSMRVPHELIGMLIGRGGETIKELKKESGARIDICKEPVEPNSQDCLVHLSGPPECVDYAKKMIEDMLSRSRERSGMQAALENRERSRSRSCSRSRSRSRSRSGDRGGGPRQTTVYVAHELIGMLIGKGGETIKTISKDSGARIEICKDEAAEREERRPVLVSGPPDCIERAKRMIEETLGRSREKRQEESERDARSYHGSGPKVIHVPSELVGILIGRGGETIKAVSRDTGARIEVSKDEREGADRSVTISGRPEEISRASEAIEDILRQARDRTGGGKPLGDEGALVAYDARGRSPIREGCLSEKVYIDECEMPYRPSFLPEHEDGLHTDLEIFVRGLPLRLTERDLWEHLYRLGATDVKEILFLRRQQQSKGMAYVVFNRHDHAVMAKHKLHGVPAASIPCEGQTRPEEQGILIVRFSESERCINGRGNAYNTDMVGLLLGSRGKCMQQVKDESGLRRILLTGRTMKSYGSVDEDPRLHMVVYYEPDEVARVQKAIAVWGEQLGKIHREIVEKLDGKGKGFGKGKGKGWPPQWPAWGPPPPMDYGRPPLPPPPPFGDHLARPPLPPPEFAGPPPALEAPVMLVRRRLTSEPGPDDSAETIKATLAGPKVLEGTALLGKELRWQPWPEVTKFNEEFKALPMRWGLRGELFCLLRMRSSGETRVCAAEVRLPLDRWPVLRTAPAVSSAARHKAFTFNEHLFIVSLDRETGKLQVFHVPDPGAPWDPAFDTTLPAEVPKEGSDEALPISRFAKLHVFYAQDRAPHVLAIEPRAPDGAESAATLFRISDPGKAWTKCDFTPPLSRKARPMAIYTKAREGGVTDFQVSIFSVEPDKNELSISLVPADTDKPWLPISRLPFSGDTRFSCIYVPGKPEPLLMAGSPKERLQKLCHLNLVEWCLAKQDDRMQPPQAPVVEEKFSRQMSSLWPDSREGHDGLLTVALPVDCTADLPVSRHAWVTTPLGGDAPLMAPPLAPPQQLPPPLGAPPGHLGGPPPPRPPFDYGPCPPPPGPPGPPFGGPPPPPGYDPRRPPSFDYPPPPFHRPPFDDRRPPFDDRRPPPFDTGAPPPPPHLRPPFERPRWGPPPFDRPPFDVRPGGPPQPPHGGPRPPSFELPPGDWHGGSRPPFDPQEQRLTEPPPPGSGGGPPPLPDVGHEVEGFRRDRGQWETAKVVARNGDNTFDLEFDGDYIEPRVPPTHFRPPPLRPPLPPGAPGAGLPPAAGNGSDAQVPEGEHRHHHRRRRRHHHRSDRDHAGTGDGAKAEAGPPVPDDGSAVADGVLPPGGPPAQMNGEGPAPVAGGEERRRHRRRHHHRSSGGDHNNNRGIGEGGGEEGGQEPPLLLPPSVVRDERGSDREEHRGSDREERRGSDREEHRGGDREEPHGGDREEHHSGDRGEDGGGGGGGGGGREEHDGGRDGFAPEEGSGPEFPERERRHRKRHREGPHPAMEELPQHHRDDMRYPQDRERGRGREHHGLDRARDFDRDRFQDRDRGPHRDRYSDRDRGLDRDRGYRDRSRSQGIVLREVDQRQYHRRRHRRGEEDFGGPVDGYPAEMSPPRRRR
mmetsp:Transcript_15878/g.39720  ORF Transcript_15878/g.39720 Transcript_15878/m.39720 type:complete len:1963 (+) Transcript_15878:175-6063(+)